MRKGQLSVAYSALKEIGFGFIPIIGLAKRLEEVASWFKRSQSIDKQSPGLILLKRVRDEAHSSQLHFKDKKDTLI